MPDLEPDVSEIDQLFEGRSDLYLEDGIAHYHTTESLRPIAEELLTSKEKIDTPVAALLECPGLVNGEVERLPKGYIIAVDSPGFTLLMNKYPDQASNLYLNVRNKIAEILHSEGEPYGNAIQLTNAGDETLTLFPQYKSNRGKLITHTQEIVLDTDERASLGVRIPSVIPQEDYSAYEESIRKHAGLEITKDQE